MGGAPGTYLSPPGSGQVAGGGNAMVGVDPSLQVPADDDSAEANVFRELEGAMRTVSCNGSLFLGRLLLQSTHNVSSSRGCD